MLQVYTIGYISKEKWKISFKNSVSVKYLQPKAKKGTKKLHQKSFHNY